MSTEQSKEELEQLGNDLSRNPPDEVAKSNILDLVTVEERHASNLEVFKKTRADMVAKRAALKTAIKIMDKQIEISLSALKVLRTPT